MGNYGDLPETDMDRQYDCHGLRMWIEPHEEHGVVLMFAGHHGEYLTREQAIDLGRIVTAFAERRM